ncbi:MAG: 1-acyl-sn-glycerol-3-phosphate acyltransferase [Saprospiraceae bacterium]|nr:1-acyl-sn-glycerol-3-phosphate acyltransferase [Saprospiraceae bacterium]
MQKWSQWLLGLLGWRYTGTETLRKIDQFVVAIGPHTSNWDFPLGLLIRWASGLDKMRFIGKESLFRPPYAWFFKALGGFPVVRSASKNQVEMYIELFKSHRVFAIVISPEGTRKKTDQLKTGYYYIAKGAGVPIVPASINYKTRYVHFHKPFYATEDPANDMAIVEHYISSGEGKYPEKGYKK